LAAKKYKRYNIIIDAPLLFEVGLDRICDTIVVIWAPYDVQSKRLAARDKLNDEQVKKRINSQMPIEKKAKLADYVVDNTGSKAELGKKIKELYCLLTLKTK
jgi:dephospho-CoA kinase